MAQRLQNRKKKIARTPLQRKYDRLVELGMPPVDDRPKGSLPEPQPSIFQTVRTFTTYGINDPVGAA